MATERATFAAGCFWGVEHAFGQIAGVTATRVGYSGGHVERPTYQQVCTDRTGHAEVVEVEFDPAAVSYETLVRRFFELHDPRTRNRQGPDVGSQYRSAIFVHSPAQRATAAAVIAELDRTRFDGGIVTQLAAATTFWPAEEYHQKYVAKHPGACGI